MNEKSISDRDFYSPAAGRRVWVQEIRASDSDGKTVLLLHGLGDHSARHEWAIDLLVAAGFDVVAIDWPGNGRSPGIRGDIPSVSRAGRLIEDFLEDSGLSPVGVFAHSTGAYLFVHWLATKPACLERLRWVWFSSPLVVPSYGQSPAKVALGRRLSRAVPALSVSTGVRPEDCYSSESEPRSFMGFRYLAEGVHNRITLRFAVSLLESEPGFWPAVEKAPDGLSFLITQGSEDPVCPLRFADELFRALPGDRKAFVAASASRHEPFREKRRAGLVNAARSWVERTRKQPGQKTSG
ncbi:MAG: alpha/beta fold hydrolase [Verrucomicrobiales bacterium]